MADLPGPLAGAASNLAIDAYTVEVVEALREDGVEPILLKGRALAVLLYDKPWTRRYGDCDLLVAPDDASGAEGVLARLGFEPALARDMTAEWQRQAQEWLRAGDRASVDLHRTIMGAHAPPQRVWDTLSRHTRPLAVGETEVRAPDPTAAALHVALHAAQHGLGQAKPLRDLELAIARLPEDTWAGAARLAERIEATNALATGLSLRPEGEALARRLGLSQPTASTVDALQVSGAPGGALALERLARIGGWRARAALLARAAVPPPAHLRYFHPLARRGPLGLAAVYALRPFDLARKLPAAWRAWRAARRTGSGSAGPGT